MSAVLAGSLLVLALLDSTSFGTLLIPVWFLVAPGRVRAGRVLVFLGTVATFYLLVGVALLLGLSVGLEHLDGLLDRPWAAWAQLVLGVGLFALSFRLGGQRDPGAGPGRVTRWRDRAMGRSGSGGVGGLVALALGAALLELGTMLPYLGAIGLLTTADTTPPVRVAGLAAYCLVMVLPALVLLVLRVAAHRQVEPLLQRIAGWLERSGAELTSWAVGIIGFLLARDALVRIPGFLELLDGLGADGPG